MESSLDIRVLFDEAIDLKLKQAISNPMCQYNLPHVNVLLIEGIIQLNALQFVGPFLPFLDELVPLLHISNLPREVLVLLLSEIFVLVVERLAVIERLHEFMQLFLLVNDGFI